MAETIHGLESRHMSMVRECGQMAAYIQRRKYYPGRVARMPKTGTIGWRIIQEILRETLRISIPVPIGVIKTAMADIPHYGTVMRRMLQRGLLVRIGHSSYDLADLGYEPDAAEYGASSADWIYGNKTGD